jgi:hypothetical protein
MMPWLIGFYFCLSFSIALVMGRLIQYGKGKAAERVALFESGQPEELPGLVSGNSYKL